MSVDIGTAFINIRAKMDGFGRDLQQATGRVTNANSAMSRSAAALGGVVRVGAAAAAAGAASIAAMGLGALRTTAQFQTLKASLETVTGSQQAANAAFARLTEFAATTPYQLQEVVGAFTKLTAMGLDPSQEALTSYGNTAAAMGKSLDQMIEAVADAATGEFERLKEFGIRARAQGDQVSFTFRGITTTVANNSEAIQGYLLGIGQTDFAGAMERQSKTLGGALSNLQDSVATTANAFGEGLAPVMTQIMQDMSKAVGGSDDLAKAMGERLGNSVKVVYDGLGNLVEQFTAADGKFAETREQLEGLGAAFTELANGPIGQTLMGAVTGMARFLGGQLVADFNKVIDVVTGLIDIVNGAAAGFGRFVTSVQTMAANAIAAIRALPGQFAQVGRDMVDGLVNGITGRTTAAADAARNMASNVMQAAKDRLDIRSPSRVFMHYGEMIAEGLRNGIAGKSPEAIAETERLASDLQQVMDGLMTDEERREKKFLENEALLNRGLIAGMDAEKYKDAMRRLVANDLPSVLETSSNVIPLRRASANIDMSGANRAADAANDMYETMKDRQADYESFWQDTFKDGLRGAMDGNLREFATNWLKQAAERGLSSALDGLANVFADLLGGILQPGSGKSGGGWMAQLGKFAMAAFGGARAGGGPVSPGRAYLVGENSPEMFMPRTEGAIWNPQQLNQLAANGNGKMNLTLQVGDFGMKQFVVDTALGTAVEVTGAAMGAQASQRRAAGVYGLR